VRRGLAGGCGSLCAGGMNRVRVLPGGMPPARVRGLIEGVACLGGDGYNCLELARAGFWRSGGVDDKLVNGDW